MSSSDGPDVASRTRSSTKKKKKDESKKGGTTGTKTPAKVVKPKVSKGSSKRQAASPEVLTAFANSVSPSPTSSSLSSVQTPPKGQKKEEKKLEKKEREEKTKKDEVVFVPSGSEGDGGSSEDEGDSSSSDSDYTSSSDSDRYYRTRRPRKKLGKVRKGERKPRLAAQYLEEIIGPHYNSVGKSLANRKFTNTRNEWESKRVGGVIDALLKKGLDDSLGLEVAVRCLMGLLTADMCQDSSLIETFEWNPPRQLISNSQLRRHLKEAKAMKKLDQKKKSSASSRSGGGKS